MIGNEFPPCACTATNNVHVFQLIEFIPQFTDRMLCAHHAEMISAQLRSEGINDIINRELPPGIYFRCDWGTFNA